MAAPLLGGRYRLEQTLSSTRMAEVWLAVDTELDRRVVVKLLAPEADRERFEREARAVAALGHTNIVQLFDFGEEDRWYMVFEYLAGGSLEDRLAGGHALAADEVARIARDVAAGLAHAHGRGVVHRDLKPGNVLFDPEGRSKIADFGIARVQGTDTLTDAGTVLGTAAYISPEQVRGEATTPASDVYAFGVILYRLLAGRLPFEADSPMELAALHRDAEPPQLSRTNGDEGRSALASVAMSALAKEPSRRPADGMALVRALEGGGGVFAAAETTRVMQALRQTRPTRRLPLIAAIGVVALACCGLLAAILLTDGPASAPAVTGPSPGVTKQTGSTAPTTLAHSSTATTESTTPTSTARPTTTVRPPTTAVTTALSPLPPPPPTDITTAVTTQPGATTPATTAP